MKLLRRLAQIVCLLAFVALLWATTWPLRSPVSVAAFVRLDPLAALAVALSPGRSWQLIGWFWPALILLAATALLGRFFCGWVCPLGTCVDVADTLLKGTRRDRRGLSDNACGRALQSPIARPAGPGRALESPPTEPRRSANPRPTVARYLLLLAVLAAAPFGVQLTWVLDPLPLLTRTFATVLFPLGAAAYNATLAPLRPLGLRAQPVPVHSFSLAVVTGGVFVIILLLGLISRRYWCRNLCPLGGLLGLVGRWGLWRRQVDAGCRDCGRCARDCKMGAIPTETPTSTRQAECLQCYDCVGSCPPASTRLGMGLRTPVEPAVDLGRREFLAACATGVAFGAVAHFGLTKDPHSARLIRPPGAILRHPDGRLARAMAEDEFLSKCLRCGQCLKACVTGGLQPAVLEAGVLGLCTPVLVPRKGWCEFGCAACGEVCPSGALVPFSVPEKKQIVIGTARIDRRRCLAWQQGSEYRQCLVCDEHCSYDALQTRPHQGQDRPFVDEKICTGCGICENACPVKPEAAIVVYAGEGRS